MMKPYVDDMNMEWKRFSRNYNE